MTTNNAELRQEKVETLNELIQATRDSAEFYADAAKAVTNPQLRSLFDDMAESKQGLVGSMAREVRAEAGEPATTAGAVALPTAAFCLGCADLAE